MTDGRLATMSAVTHRYGDVVALDGLNLEIRAGEVLAVLGPNGAGKTTAIGLLLARIIQCAVKRRHSSAGANPARQLSLQPVAVGADDGGNDIG